MTVNICSALVLDIGGKQPYIFSSNKLKENIGASFIIAHQLFTSLLINSIKTFCNYEYSDAKALVNDWKSFPDQLFTKDHPLEIGYIGGGAALILFKPQTQDRLRKFVQDYSLAVLTKYPGVELRIAYIHNFQYDQKGTVHYWKNNQDKLRIAMGESRKNSPILSHPFKHGIARDCPLSGEAQEQLDPQSGQWISKYSASKLLENNKANLHFADTFQHILGDRFRLTDAIEELNDAEDKSYIAVVHIDGNEMGELFKTAEDLNAMRRMSDKVNQKLRCTLEALLRHLVELLEGPLLTLKLHQQGEGPRTLPFRSIINAGDDITFVCHGQLGIYLAEKYMELLADKNIGDLAIQSCAGIAIVHTKYPFFRAYHLTEELVGAAKRKSRQFKHNCWINFHISSGGYTGDFETIEARKYRVGRQELYHGPYPINKEEETESPLPFSTIKHQLRKMLYHPSPEKRWPKNKLLEVRQALSASKVEQAYIKARLSARGLHLPEEQLHQFPYYDLTELIDFYPKELLFDD